MLRSIFVIAGLAALVFAFTQTREAPVRPAPELVSGKWINSDPITLASRKGKVTIVHFWTFACSNCQANLPAYDRLYAKYKPLGVEMVGIHTPELAQEKVESNVVQAVKDRKIAYPVLIDPVGENWIKWKQEYWPTVYVVDKQGNIRFTWVGEFGYQGAHGEQEVMKWVDYLLKH